MKIDEFAGGQIGIARKKFAKHSNTLSFFSPFRSSSSSSCSSSSSRENIEFEKLYRSSIGLPRDWNFAGDELYPYLERLGKSSGDEERERNSKEIFNLSLIVASERWDKRCERREEKEV